VVELGLWRDYAQTKRNGHRPWCEDGACALGLGVLMPHTLYHGRGQSHSMPWLLWKTHFSLLLYLSQSIRRDLRREVWTLYYTWNLEIWIQNPGQKNLERLDSHRSRFVTKWLKVGPEKLALLNLELWNDLFAKKSKKHKKIELRQAPSGRNQFYLALIFLCLFHHGEPWLTWSYEFKLIVTWESVWSRDVRIANWYENCKPANLYENCKRPRRMLP
jgi:hypothetical protein